MIRESQIRGKHSTGISYVYDGKIKTIIEPLPSRKFLDLHWGVIEEDLSKEKIISVIAHTRYSTSSPDDHQPVYNDKLSLILNGVITQADPKDWNSLFPNIECRTNNDAEIALQYVGMDKSPLTLCKQEKVSMAICTLKVDGTIFAYRNGKRPLYYITLDNRQTTIVSSTSDILVRSLKDLNIAPSPFSPGYAQHVYPSGTSRYGVIQMKDYQIKDVGCGL